MGVSLARPPNAPQCPEEGQWVRLCALYAQSLRQSAEGAGPLQAERAVAEYGAAAALERAAQGWADGDAGAARSWMAAAEHALVSVLLPVPWRR